MFTRWTALVLLATLSFSLRDAAAQSATETAQVLKELELLQKNRADQFKTGLSGHIQSFSTAAASKSTAVNLYEDAVQAVEYEGKPKDGSEFAAWRDKNHELLISSEFQTAVQLHLQYIVLSLRRLDGQKTEESIPALIDYVDRLNTLMMDFYKRDKEKNDVQIRNEKARPKDKQGDKTNKGVANLGRDVLNKGLSGSVFIRWYRLEGYMGGLKDWEQSSGNIEGIVDKVLMPYMRDKKDSRLIKLWDERMVRAQMAAQKSELDIDMDKFQNQTLPTLMWNRAQDRLVLGQRSVAISEMLNTVKTYQSHPDFDKWVKELTALVKGDASAAPAETPATAATDTAPGN